LKSNDRDVVGITEAVVALTQVIFTFKTVNAEIKRSIQGI
jgi:hypothetical protein